GWASAFYIWSYINIVIQDDSTILNIRRPQDQEPFIAYIIRTVRQTGDKFPQLTKSLFLPLLRLPKLRKPQPWYGFAFAGEKLLHQALFVGLEGVQLSGFRCDQIIQRSQAVGDFVLFFWLGNGKRQPHEIIICDAHAVMPSANAGRLTHVLMPMRRFEVVRKKIVVATVKPEDRVQRGHYPRANIVLGYRPDWCAR